MYIHCEVDAALVHIFLISGAQAEEAASICDTLVS